MSVRPSVSRQSWPGENKGRYWGTVDFSNSTIFRSQGNADIVIAITIFVDITVSFTKTDFLILSHTSIYKYRKIVLGEHYT